MKRKGGRGKCAACDHVEADAINRALAAGTSLSKVTKRYGITSPALSAHRRNHLSPALVAVHGEKLAAGARTIVEEMTDLIAQMKAILTQAVKSKNVGQALAANQQLRSNLELLAKLTGALDERAVMTVNLATSKEWVDLRTVIMTTLVDYPDANRAVADRVAMLNVPENGHSKSTVHKEN